MRIIIGFLFALTLTVCPEAHAGWKKVAYLNSSKVFKKIKAEKCSYRVSYATTNNDMSQKAYLALPNALISKEPAGTAYLFESFESEAIAAFYGSLFGGNIDTKPYRLLLTVAKDPGQANGSIVQFNFGAEGTSLSSQNEGDNTKLGSITLEANC